MFLVGRAGGSGGWVQKLIFFLVQSLSSLVGLVGAAEAGLIFTTDKSIGA